MAVLRGDPDAVAAVADALEFEHKYTSGVIAWAPEDRPSDQEHQTGCSTSSSRPPGPGWPRIATRGRRCDLETGKSLNIAPRRAGSRLTTPWSRP